MMLVDIIKFLFPLHMQVLSAVSGVVDGDCDGGGLGGRHGVPLGRMAPAQQDGSGGEEL